QATLGRGVALRIGGVELVRAHDAPDVVAVVVRIVGGDTRPEPGDLQQQLGAAEVHEVVVVGDLVVVPDVVRHGRADVALAMRVVCNPSSRDRVQVDP